MPNERKHDWTTVLAFGALAGGLVGLAYYLLSLNNSAQAHNVENDWEFTQGTAPIYGTNSVRFKEAMHAFTSLVSMERVGCQVLELTDVSCSMCLTEELEPGWLPGEFNLTFQRMLNSFKLRAMPAPVAELAHIWYAHSVRCQKFFAHNSDVHYELILEMLRSSDVVIYPLQRNGHRAYVEIWRTSPDNYNIRVFDLGDRDYLVQQLKKPGEKSSLSREELFIELENITSGEANYFMTADFPDCHACLPEYSQSIGNCVVKNLLAAIQQDALDRYGHAGLRVFACFYVELLRATLLEAHQYADGNFFQGLPNFDGVCQLVGSNQIAFSDDCQRKLDELQGVYNSLWLKCLQQGTVTSDCGTCSMDGLGLASMFADPSAATERDKGLRRYGKDAKDIAEFFERLSRAVVSGTSLDYGVIPHSLGGSYVDTHQAQHLLQGASRPGKSYFLPAIGTNARSPVINALANSVTKLVSEFCKRNKISGTAARYENFIVDVGFNIGELRGGRKSSLTSCIKIEGFTGARYHIFPVSPDEAGHVINATEYLPTGAMLTSRQRQSLRH